MLWNPRDGTVDPHWPTPESQLRIERFSSQVQQQYRERYFGVPPHDKQSKEQKEKAESNIGEPEPVGGTGEGEP